MKKIVIITTISIFLVLASQLFVSPYMYIAGNECDPKVSAVYKNWCYGTTLGKGFPITYKPDGGGSVYTFGNSEFNYKNFIVNFAFYYLLISIIVGGYTLIKKSRA